MLLLHRCLISFGVIWVIIINTVSLIGCLSLRKNGGGLGVPNLRDFNLALLASWSKRFFDDRNSDWKKIICFKYNVDKPNILWSKAGNGSPFWKSITWAFAAAKVFYRWVRWNGENVSFWHVTWLAGCSLKTRFWDLFVICQQQDASTAQVWDGVICISPLEGVWMNLP